MQRVGTVAGGGRDFTIETGNESWRFKNRVA
jgi:hypothetical protein